MSKVQIDGVTYVPESDCRSIAGLQERIDRAVDALNSPLDWDIEYVVQVLNGDLPVCPECLDECYDNPRVAAGMKCSRCSYGAL